MPIGIGGRGGGEAFTVEKITLWGEIKQIAVHSFIYALMGLLQIVLLAIEALLLGPLSGLVFIAAAVALQFGVSVTSIPGTLSANLRNRYLKKEKPGHVWAAQLMLLVGGVLLLLIALSSNWPNIYRWRIVSDSAASHAVMASWHGGDWFQINEIEFLMRPVLIATLPFVFWNALLIAKWAAKMEATQPKFREAIIGEVSPDSHAGPWGERPKPSRLGRGGEIQSEKRVVPPAPYTQERIEQ